MLVHITGFVRLLLSTNIEELILVLCHREKDLYITSFRSLIHTSKKTRLYLAQNHNFLPRELKLLDRLPQNLLR